MAGILIAWELGETLWHHARCLRLARELVARGHAVTLAHKDVRLPAGQTTAPGITLLAAPLTQQASASSSPPVNYADVLRASGFAEPQGVAARLHAWWGLFALVRLNVLVADPAPTALLAARGAGVPHLAVGNGFSIPPDTSPWLSIRLCETVSDQALAVAETRLDHLLVAAQKALGPTRTVRVRDLFGVHDILDTFAEPDRNGMRSDGRHVGSIVSVPQALRVAWQSMEGAHVLAYLRPAVPGFQSILQALARLDAEVLCVAPGMSPGAAKHYVTRRLCIALTPLDLSPLLVERADLYVSLGHTGFSTQVLLESGSLAIWPWYVEQALFAHRLEARGRKVARWPDRCGQRHRVIARIARQPGLSARHPRISQPPRRLLARPGHRTKPVPH